MSELLFVATSCRMPAPSVRNSVSAGSSGEPMRPAKDSAINPNVPSPVIEKRYRSTSAAGFIANGFALAGL